MHRLPQGTVGNYHEGVEYVIKKPNIISRVRGRPSASALLPPPPPEEEIEVIYTDCTAVSQCIATPVSTPCAGAPDAVTLAHHLDQLSQDPVPVVEVDDGVLSFVTNPPAMNGELLNFVGTGGSPDSHMLNFLASGANGGQSDFGLGLMDSSGPQPQLTVQTSGENIILFLQEGTNGLEPLPYTTGDMTPESYILVQIDSDGTLRPANQMQEEVAPVPPAIVEPPPPPMREEDRPKPFRYLPTEEDELPESERMMGNMDNVTVSPYLSVLQGQEINLTRGMLMLTSTTTAEELEHEPIDTGTETSVQTFISATETITITTTVPTKTAIQPKPISSAQRKVQAKPIQPNSRPVTASPPIVVAHTTAGPVETTIRPAGTAFPRVETTAAGATKVPKTMPADNSTPVSETSSGSSKTLIVRTGGSQMPFKCQSCDAEFQYSTSLRTHERIHITATSTASASKSSCVSQAVAIPTSGTGSGALLSVTPVLSTTNPPDNIPKVQSVPVKVTAPLTQLATADPLTSPTAAGAETASEPAESKTCEFCSKVLKSAYDWLRHRLNHEEAGLVCGLCSREFSTKKYLLNHISVHVNGAGASQFECSVCALTFKTAEDLSAHIRIHNSKTKTARVEKTASNEHGDQKSKPARNDALSVKVTKQKVVSKETNTKTPTTNAGAVKTKTATVTTRGASRNEAVTPPKTRITKNEAALVTATKSAMTRKRPIPNPTPALPDADPPAVLVNKRSLRSSAPSIETLQIVEPTSSLRNSTRRTTQKLKEVEAPLRKRGRQ